jgi:hypothetical protein
MAAGQRSAPAAEHSGLTRLILHSTGFLAPPIVMTPVVVLACLQTVMTACACLSGGAMH